MHVNNDRYHAAFMLILPQKWGTGTLNIFIIEMFPYLNLPVQSDEQHLSCCQSFEVKCHFSCKVLLIWLQYVEFRVSIVFSLVELVRSNVGCFVSLFIETYIPQQRNSIR